MKVCVTRNSEAKSNAGILRVIDALQSFGYEPLTLTRNRSNAKAKPYLFNDTFELNNQSIENYEIQLHSDMGKGMRNLINLINYQLRIFIWFVKNKKKFDVIHAFDLDVGLPALIAAKITNKKIIYHIADFYIDSRLGIPKGIKKIIRGLEFHIISKADATIICTEERKDQIIGSKPQKLYVVHNSPVEVRNNQSISEKNKDSCIDKNLIKLCYVGGLSEIRFIKEILDIVRDDSRLFLSIAGFGTLHNHVKKYAEKYDNIEYFGRVSYQEALDLYSNCDMMFAMYDPKHPNHKYSAPNKVYEAMMMGKPIIVAKNTGIDTLVQNERIGFVVDYSMDSFKKAIDFVINNNEEILETKKRSKNAYEKYSWSNMKARICEIYKSL